jgi:hypothetical protein
VKVVVLSSCELVSRHGLHMRRPNDPSLYPTPTKNMVKTEIIAADLNPIEFMYPYVKWMTSQCAFHFEVAKKQQIRSFRQ